MSRMNRSTDAAASHNDDIDNGEAKPRPNEERALSFSQVAGLKRGGSESDDTTTSATRPPKKRGRGAPRKAPPENVSEEVTQKLEERRAYNRKNAARARQRVKDQVADLTEKVEKYVAQCSDLTRSNTALVAENSQLKRENQKLLDLLSAAAASGSVGGSFNSTAATATAIATTNVNAITGAGSFGAPLQQPMLAQPQHMPLPPSQQADGSLSTMLNLLQTLSNTNTQASSTTTATNNWTQPPIPSLHQPPLQQQQQQNNPQEQLQLQQLQGIQWNLPSAASLLSMLGETGVALPQPPSASLPQPPSATATAAPMPANSSAQEFTAGGQQQQVDDDGQDSGESLD